MRITCEKKTCTKKVNQNFKENAGKAAVEPRKPPPQAEKPEG